MDDSYRQWHNQLWDAIKKHEESIDIIIASDLKMLPPGAMLWDKRACTYSLELLTRHAPCNGGGGCDYDYYQHKGREGRILCHGCGGGEFPCVEVEELASWWSLPFYEH